MARPGHGASAVRHQGDCCSWLPAGGTKGHRVARGGTGGSVRPPLPPAGSVSRWSRLVPRAQQGLGGTCLWRLQAAGTLGLSGAPPPPCCSLLLCHGVPTTGCTCRRQGKELSEGSWGSPVAVPQHLLDGVRGPGTPNAARGPRAAFSQGGLSIRCLASWRTDGPGSPQPTWAPLGFLSLRLAATTAHMHPAPGRGALGREGGLGTGPCRAARWSGVWRAGKCGGEACVAGSSGAPGRWAASAELSRILGHQGILTPVKGGAVLRAGPFPARRGPRVRA